MFRKTTYQTLVFAHKDKVYRYAYYMLRDEMDAEDATQDIFVKLWQKFEEINITKAKSWLMRTTHNYCIDIIRKRQRTTDKHVVLEDFNQNSAQEAEGLSNDPVRNAQNSHLKEVIDNAVGKLPEKIKSVFLMYEVQGMKYREIADVLDMPINSVKVTMLRARKQLQEELRYER